MRLSPVLFLSLLAACSQKEETAKAAPSVEAAAPAPTEFKAQPLSDEDEKRTIQSVQNLKTDDGATILEVLQSIEKTRPKQFKLAGFEMLYSGDGKPSQVAACYWIGSARKADDKFCDIGYDYKSLKPAVGSASQEEQNGLTVMKLQRGRAAFLQHVEKTYSDTCVDYDTKKKTC